MGGFWRFKDNEDGFSVYKSTHIDTERDMNSFGDNPMSPSQPLLISNQELFQYLKSNCDKFSLWSKIRFNTKVTCVTVEDKQGEKPFIRHGLCSYYKLATENHKWIVKWALMDPDTQEIQEEGEEIFDGVLVCTGRHGHGGWIPPFPGLKDFKKPYVHSSKYKYPEKHNLQGKTVLVVGTLAVLWVNCRTYVIIGVGNSGIDIVTEVAQSAGKTILLARSGSWIFKVKHGEETFSEVLLDRFTTNLIL